MQQMHINAWGINYPSRHTYVCTYLYGYDDLRIRTLGIEMHIETNLKELALRTFMQVIYVRSYKVKPKYGSVAIK